MRLLDTGSLDEALTVVEECGAAALETGNEAALLIESVARARIAMQQGDPSSALECASSALTRAAHLDDAGLTATALVESGLARQALGRSDEAVEDLERAVARSMDETDRPHFQQSCLALAEVRLCRGECREAMDAARRASEWALATGDTVSLEKARGILDHSRGQDPVE